MTQAQYLQAAELLVRDPDFVNFPAIPHGLPSGGDVPPTFRAAGPLLRDGRLVDELKRTTGLEVTFFQAGKIRYLCY